MFSTVFRRRLRKSLSSLQKGQALPEYALILALITVFCIGALSYFGKQISSSLQNLGNEVTKATDSGAKGAAQNGSN